MPQISLTVPRRLPRRATWNRLLLRSLRDSGRFAIRHGGLPAVPHTWRFRKNFHWMRLNGVTIGVDTWDRLNPANSGHPDLNEADLLLKIQHRPDPFWKTVEQRHDLRVSAWTMFGYEDFPCGAFRWTDRSHSHLYTYSGSVTHSKRRWLRHMRRTGVAVFGVQKADEYLPLLSESRWGVSLKGMSDRYCDGKNRREQAFTSLGMPLVLNYVPHYPFPFRPGVDFVLLNTPGDLDRLAEIDPRPFAEASRRLWNDHFSPAGAATTLLKVVKGMMERPSEWPENPASTGATTR